MFVTILYHNCIDHAHIMGLVLLVCLFLREELFIGRQASDWRYGSWYGLALWNISEVLAHISTCLPSPLHHTPITPHAVTILGGQLHGNMMTDELFCSQWLQLTVQTALTGHVMWWVEWVCARVQYHWRGRRLGLMDRRVHRLRDHYCRDVWLITGE